MFIINATGAVNFAQGELVMAGGYLAAALSAYISAGPVYIRTRETSSVMRDIRSPVLLRL